VERLVNAYRASIGKSEEKNHLEDSGVFGRTRLKYISGNSMRGCRHYSSGSG
jgi:hypothetical protein